MIRVFDQLRTGHGSHKTVYVAPMKVWLFLAHQLLISRLLISDRALWCRLCRRSFRSARETGALGLRPRG